jgi:hypothetical protein
MDETTRRGKIGRLPHHLREALNLRLLNGEPGPKILRWINAEEEAVKVLDEWFDGAPVDAQNLSAWRLGGYRDWVRRRERVENLKTLAGFARDLAKEAGGIADGAAAIIGGHILEALEQAGNLVVTGGGDDAEADPADGLAKMAKAVASLQNSSVARAKLDLAKRDSARKEEELSLAKEKFQRQTVEAFLRWAKSDDARKILDSGAPKHVQMDLLRELMFGPDDAGNEG